MTGPFVSWIASYPRSGNTWVRALLIAYQQGDLFDVNRLEPIPGEPPPAFYRMLWPGAEEYEKLDWAHMRALALRNYYETRRSKEFVLKTHTANINLSGVHLIPRGYTNRAVYVVRDPRDVLCSCAAYFGKSHRKMLDLMFERGHMLTDENTGVWQFVSSYKNHIVGWIKEKSFPVHVVRYGDLLRQPEYELEKMLKFLDPDCAIDVKCISSAVEKCEIQQFRDIEATRGFRERPPGVERFFGAAKEGRWRKELKTELADELIDRLGLEDSVCKFSTDLGDASVVNGTEAAAIRN